MNIYKYISIRELNRYPNPKILNRLMIKESFYSKTFMRLSFGY